MTIHEMTRPEAERFLSRHLGIDAPGSLFKVGGSATSVGDRHTLVLDRTSPIFDGPPWAIIVQDVNGSPLIRINVVTL